MEKELDYKKKLAELVNAKKADESILASLKELDKAYDKAQKEIEKIDKVVEELQLSIDEKNEVKNNTSIFKIKAFITIVKEIKVLKNEIKNKEEEKAYLTEFCEEKIKQANIIKTEIDKQYIAYQENEMFAKAIEKISNNNIEMSTEFYKRYIDHMNVYLNDVYSIEKNTKISEPNPQDLLIMVEYLKKSVEKEQKAKDEKTTKKTAKKTTTKKTTTAKSTTKTTTKRTTTRKKAETEKKEVVNV